jgi:hypothetical protein
VLAQGVAQSAMRLTCAPLRSHVPEGVQRIHLPRAPSLRAEAGADVGAGRHGVFCGVNRHPQERLSVSSSVSERAKRPLGSASSVSA